MLNATNRFFLLFGFGFLRQGFSVTLAPFLELALVDQARFELKKRPDSASGVLRLKVCATTQLNPANS